MHQWRAGAPTSQGTGSGSHRPKAPRNHRPPTRATVATPQSLTPNPPSPARACRRRAAASAAAAPRGTPSSCTLLASLPTAGRCISGWSWNELSHNFTIMHGHQGTLEKERHPRSIRIERSLDPDVMGLEFHQEQMLETARTKAAWISANETAWEWEAHRCGGLFLCERHWRRSA